jgi:hypothetical protein
MTKTIGVRVLHATVLVVGLSLALPAHGAAVSPGYDLLETDIGTTYDDLDLPAGFFGPGSQPFEGRVFFEGVPFNTWDPDGPGPQPPVTGLYYTDTIVRRNALAPPPSATIPIEIRELHLVSAAPITVVGGPGAGLWNVHADVTLDPGTGSVFPPQALGSMTIRHEDANGGTFDSTLSVASAVTFRRIFPGPMVIGPVVGPALTFTVTGAPWCNTANPLGYPFGHTATDVVGLTSNFFASVSCVNATARPFPITYSVDGGRFNPLRTGAALTPVPNPAEGRFQPVAVHLPPNDVFALGTAPGANGYATEGEIFQAAGNTLGLPPNTTNVDRMSAALGIGPGGTPPFIGPFAPNPGAPVPLPAPPGVLGPPGAFGPPPGNAVGTLGLVPNDNVDGLSYGRDSGNVLYFSVDPFSIGVPFSAVRFHAVTSPGPAALGGPLPTNPGGGDPGDEAAGDVYKSLQLLNFGSYIPLHFANGMFAPPAFLAPNALVFDELALGLQAPALNGSAIAPPEDDLDGLELADTGDRVFGVDIRALGAVGPDGIPDRCTFFSIDTASPSNSLFVAPGFLSSPDDILVTPAGGFTFGVFADGVAHIGLLPGDDIDALALSDVRGLCTLDPGLDEALFSFHPGSPNVLVGCDGVAGSGDEVSPADVFYTNFTTPFCSPGPPAPYVSAGGLGLLISDNVNAIDILPWIKHPNPGQPPTPPPWPVKTLTGEQAARAAHGIRVSEKRRYPHFTVGDFQINSVMLGPIIANVQGPTEVEALSEQLNPDTLNSHIPTEIVLMQLNGNAGPAGPVQIRAGRNLMPTLPRTHGEIQGNGPGQFFPADSFFDVFFQVDLPAFGLQLRNQTPFRVQGSILELPPQGNVYLGNDPVDLFDQFNNFAGQLVFGRHQPRCQSDADCNDDGNPCTADVCDIAGGVCLHSPLPDSDGDGVCDPADNCPGLPNSGGQGPIVFGQTVKAVTKTQFCWPNPTSAEWLQGNLGVVSTYGFNSMNSVNAACFIDGTVPLPNQGLYYLVRHNCPAGSWQNDLGSEPNRDATLP